MIAPFQNSLHFAKKLDKEDPLKEYRNQFHFPKTGKGEESIYLCGNSLGLQPKLAAEEINDVLLNWQNRGVEGHFEGENPWIGYNEKLKPSMAKIVGAFHSEIAILNTLTVNLHLLLVSFYCPNPDRFKILIEKDTFPSDKYMVASQARFRGYDPREAIVEIQPRKGSMLLYEEDILEQIDKNGDQIALIMLGGLNYFTGQVLPISTITSLAKSRGCMVGFDLAHAAGNIPLQLHEDHVDFAAWCNYKYLNGGPGCIASIFIHEKHHDSNLPRLEGWWGNKLPNRFEMADEFDPEVGAEAWVMSTPPTLAIAPIKASLDLFDEIGMQALRTKSVKLTGFLEFLIKDLHNPKIEIITPANIEERGGQLSIQVKNVDKKLFEALIDRNVILDWREPNVIRVAPTPMYNSFEDVYRFVAVLKECLESRREL